VPTIEKTKLQLQDYYIILHFLSIFFYEEDEEGQNIYFTQAVIKESTFSQDFENAVVKSEFMLKDFFKLE